MKSADPLGKYFWELFKIASDADMEFQALCGVYYQLIIGGGDLDGNDEDYLFAFDSFYFLIVGTTESLGVPANINS